MTQRDGRRFSRWRAFVWLVFIAIPLIDAINRRQAAPAKGLAIAAATVFVTVFAVLVLSGHRPLPPIRGIPTVSVLLAIAVALTLTDGSGWGTLFIFSVAACGAALPRRLAGPAVPVCGALCVGSLLAGGATVGGTIGYTTATLGIGMMMLALADLRMRNCELTEARAEVARLAVAAERERFARDLHDLLGHSLSVITLKAELAGRLLPGQAGDAAAHVAEIEQVARGALAEVRDAVSGYRQPTLDGELAGARMALSAAGIEAEVEGSSISLDPSVEALLAWAVREGATNVIRHSHAKHCSVRITAGLDGAVVEVLDDGHPESVDPLRRNGHMGHGLAGLAERVGHIQGRVEAGQRPEGGFRLAVSVPLPVG